MASSSRLHGLAEAILDEVLLWLPWQDVEASVACLGRSWVGVRSRVMGKRRGLSLSKAQCEGLAGSRFAALLSACHALTRLELGDDEWQHESAWFSDSSTEGFAASRQAFWTLLETGPSSEGWTCPPPPLRVFRCRTSVSCGWVIVATARTLLALDLTSDLHAPWSAASVLLEALWEHCQQRPARPLFPALRDLRLG